MRAPGELAVACVAASGAYAPLWVAKDEGLFAKHGLDVSLRRLGPAAGIEALITGEVDLYAGGTAALTAAIDGADIVYIGSIVDRFVLSLFVPSGITSVIELAGRVVAVTQPGTPTDAGARLVLRGAGLVPDQDVRLAYLGAGTNILAALQRGGIQGGVLSPPTTALARRAGLRELVDLGKRPERFPQTAFVARRNDVDSGRDRLLRFFRGHSDGVRLARDTPARAREIIPRYTGVSESDVTAETYNAFAPCWEMPPFVAEAGIQSALSVSPHPRARLVRATDFIDHRCIARQFQQHDIPDRKLVNDVYTHDMDKSLDLAGLRPTFQQDAAVEQALRTNWSIVKDWTSARDSDLAEEPMVKPDLTTRMIEAGRQFLEELDRHKFRARACFWFYFPESDRWRFVVASPERRVRGPLAAYRKLDALARKVTHAIELFGPGDVTVLKDNDSLVVVLRKAISPRPGIGGVRLTNAAVNGTFVDDAYIYRLT